MLILANEEKKRKSKFQTKLFIVKERKEISHKEFQDSCLKTISQGGLN